MALFSTLLEEFYNIIRLLGQAQREAASGVLARSVALLHIDILDAESDDRSCKR
jgi:hypothetical protein